MTDIIHASLAFESSSLKSALDDKAEGYIEGWATTPKQDSYDDIIESGAFADSIALRGITGPRGVKLLLNHNPEQVAGAITDLRYIGGRLYIAAQMSLDIGYVADMHKAMKAAGGLSFSVGFRTLDFIIDADYVRHITKGDLLEVSIVPFPANDEAQISEFKSQRMAGAAQAPAPMSTVAEFEKFLIAKGLAKSRNEAQEITRAVKSCPAFMAQAAAAPMQAQQQSEEQPMQAQLKKAMAAFASVVENFGKGA